ncbi:hypothetical protein OHC33_008134 [Knufia fluminis]|uniref:Uncharacterized protein n=1 Tax=Knufia fluminis TaxID=191047 RepID=A0AAN8I5S0_9EURO|nr:hypothetical protein OHC33_008134 [Knufia fluminis]
MPNDGGWAPRRVTRAPGQNSLGAPSLRSQAITNNHSRRDAAAAASALGNVPSGSVIAYSVSVAGTNQTRNVRVNTEAKDYKLGDIVEIPHLVLAMDPTQTDDDYKVKTRVGEICPKWRPAVVVALYQQRMTVLPCYTCKKNGLTRKPDHYKTTAMSIAHPGTLIGPQSQYLSEEVLLIDDNWKVEIGQHINLNEPVSINYAWPITKLSRLNKESAAALYKRFRIVHHMGTVEPVDNHENYFRRKMQEDQLAIRAQAPKAKPVTDEDGFTLKTNKTRGSRL